MTKKYACIDFEYNGTSEEKLNLVCCSISFSNVDPVLEFWTHRDESERIRLVKAIKDLNDMGYIFLAFNVVAEAHSFISLGLDPTDFQWLDLQVEYKMLLNHNHEYMYGKQLYNGQVKKTSPPKNKWQWTEEEKRAADNSKPQKSLASCLYKLLGIIVDTDHKNEMRDIIIRANYEEIEANKKPIQDYCTSDTKYLFPAWLKVIEAYRKHLSSVIVIEKDGEKIEKEGYRPTIEEVLYRGESAARTAKMISLGYPVNVDKVRKFAASVPDINKEMCEDINSQFEEGKKPFRWNNKEQRYSKQIKLWKQWIGESDYADTWMRTKKEAYSTSIDAFEKQFSWRHEYPRGNFFAQVMRYLKTQRSFNGFIPKSANAKNKETFFDSLGSDGRVRAWLNPYGSQSARFQPKATGFLPLKASWMRSMIEPKKGRAIASIDYGSQEFLIAALISKDMNMIDAYKSGDVYLYFAKLAGAVPWDGKKEDYAAERNLFKSTTLGISYNMGALGLSKKLTDDTGREVTEKEAQELINKFELAYPNYKKWIGDLRYTYDNYSRCIKLPDGWIMFGDNDNKRSVSNVPIQGFGSCILRQAIKNSQNSNLDIIFPLHDALYSEYLSQDFSAIDLLAESMKKAFVYYFDDDMKEHASLIRLDANVWSPDYEDGYFTTPKGLHVKSQKIYIDERSVSEYERFKKYME